MTKLLIAAALILLLGLPWFAEAGIPPLLVALAGVGCGIAAVLRGARPLPGDAGLAPSRGADADAQAVGYKIDHAKRNGIGITDIGGAA
jgi:hypothetical protein